MANPILDVQNLTKSFGERMLFKDISFSIAEGQHVGLIAQNGKGKSTLLSILTNEDSADSGSVIYRNDVKIGILCQTPAIQPEQTVMEFCNEKSTTQEQHQNAKQILTQLRITDLSQPMGQLSGGQQKRVALASVLMNDPDFLILDEPTNFVDNRFEYEFYNMVRELSDRMAIVMVSHDLGTITSVVKSIVCVNKSVHRHDSNILTEEQLQNYNCPIQIISHGKVPHTVLCEHEH